MVSRRRLAALLVASSLASVIASRAVGAQRQDSTRADSARADSLRRQALGKVVVTGTRLSGAADERTPVQVDVLPTRDLAPGPDAVATAVARLPGVSAYDDQGTRAQPTLNLRGFTLSPVVGVPQGVSVFLDGVRINEPDAQELFFDLVPMDAVSRAELVRGPVALYGKNTLAGALLLFTERGSSVPQLDAELEGGAYGYRGARVSASGMRAGFDGFLMARGSQEDGWREATSARTRTIFANVGHKGEGENDLAATLLYAHDHIMQAGSLPESWMAADPRANYTEGDFTDPELFHLSLRGTRAVLGGVLRANVYERHDDIYQFNVNVDAPNVTVLVGNNSVGGTAEIARATRLGRFPLGLTLGGEYARNAIRYRILNQPTDSAQTLPDDCDPSGLCERASVDEDNAALFAEGALDLNERLTLNVAGRADYVRTPFRDLRDAANDGVGEYFRFSPRLGANYRWSEELRGYAAVSAGFRSPAPLENACADAAAPCPLPSSLGDDPPLRPVTVIDYEAGADWEPVRGSTIDLVAFRADARDEIAFVASRTTAGYFQNLPRTRRQGIELSGTTRLPRGLRVAASYALLDATYRAEARLASADTAALPAEPGDRFPLSPVHRGSVTLGWARLLRGALFDAELVTTAQSSQFLRGDEANDRAPLPGYALSALRVSLDHPRYAVSAYVSNLFDTRYQSFGVFAGNPKGPFGGPRPAGDVPVERFLTPGYPRAIVVSVTGKL